MKLSMRLLKAKQAHRPPGYLGDVLSHAHRVEGDDVFLSENAYISLCHRYRHMGLGDLVASVATPIARALGLPCIDPATQQLRPESGCAKRKAALNRLTQ
jgi:hypothetical protein